MRLGPVPRVRDALPSDLDQIVAFNARLAFETESRTLDPPTLAAGVFSALSDPARLRYWVAHLPDSTEIVGQAAITREWSDWRNGWIWWLQSVYVTSDARGQGVFRSLYVHIRSEASRSSDVVGLRLYVENHNQRAMDVYRSLGMTDGGYQVLEDFWPERPCRSKVKFT